MLQQKPGPNILLAHACNARGRWGSGIAKQFAQKYPDAYKQYAAKCKTGTDCVHAGDTFIVNEGSIHIGCLITSCGYASEVDSPENIVENTRKALAELFVLLAHRPEITEIHSPKINSGLFRTPWHLTEAVIVEALKGKTIKWVVWEL